MVKAATSLAERRELDDGVEKWKADALRSRSCGALRFYHQARDRLRLLIQ